MSTCIIESRNFPSWLCLTLGNVPLTWLCCVATTLLWGQNCCPEARGAGVAYKKEKREFHETETARLWDLNHVVLPTPHPIRASTPPPLGVFWGKEKKSRGLAISVWYSG